MDRGHRRDRPQEPQDRGTQGEPGADIVVLGMALEMARLANAALARAGLPTATVVGEARGGAALMTELSMIVRGPVDFGALATALSGLRPRAPAWR